MPRKPSKNGASAATIGFEAKLWLAADKLRNNMDAAEYKHVVLGLIFLKYISDTFEQMRDKLVAGQGDYAGANPEDADEYKAENVFWVPKEARALTTTCAGPTAPRARVIRITPGITSSTLLHPRPAPPGAWPA